MITIWLYSLPLLLAMGALAWVYAYRRDNVNIVDSLWSLFFLAAALTYLAVAGQSNAVSIALIVAVAVWALRLSAHLALRNAGKPEDRRYAAMRERNPRFATQSLITVFALQAVLAWLLSAPLAAAIAAPTAFSLWHVAALGLFGTGLFFEAVADWQLMQFKRRPENCDRVLQSGVWAVSRHPNYFGEACIQWSFYLFALAAGYAWTIVAPIAMTFLLLKVSGVSLLERDIQQRRPAYRDYIERTPAFVPWFPKTGDTAGEAKEHHS